MPWINQDLCTGCCVCIEECPVEAISLNENEKAVIDDDKCIRCGHCHDVCPVDAVRHDSERIPQEVEANIDKVNQLLKHYNDKDEQLAFLERMIRHFKKQKKVADLTMEKITAMISDRGQK